MAVGSLLQTYLSRFGVSTEGMSGETIGFAAALDAVARVDPPIARAILGELVDQRTHLKLIASENYASPAALLAMWNWLSDKYADGVLPTDSGQLCRHRSDGVGPATLLLDYDDVRRRAHEERPLIPIAGYSSYARLVTFRVLREIADAVGATFIVDMAHFARLVAG